ncbi:hypothetical protein [Pseudooceanicola sp. HF7]|uniref:hypothetical protein n=1 Tax=Pseudooceanicola sp. HF7 TaxID=2721560 RepID=UPI00142FBD83|nr:hypothetical protein [Pseudooceanicola sp. HF7]NIZ08935.1 hypothetical protein [Pseudooceanicola sp. HF7]
MRVTLTLAGGIAAAFLLSGCEEPTVVSLSPTMPPEQICLNAVKARTGTSEVEVTGSDLILNGSAVLLSVGNQATPWRCIAYDNGTVGQITPVTDDAYI